MNFDDLMAVIVAEVGSSSAQRIEERLRLEMQGCRLTIRKRRSLTREMIDSAAPGRPKEAARKLGVHPSTVYRCLRVR